MYHSWADSGALYSGWVANLSVIYIPVKLLTKAPLYSIQYLLDSRTRIESQVGRWFLFFQHESHPLCSICNQMLSIFKSISSTVIPNRTPKTAFFFCSFTVKVFFSCWLCPVSGVPMGETLKTTALVFEEAEVVFGNFVYRQFHILV